MKRAARRYALIVLFSCLMLARGHAATYHLDLVNNVVLQNAVLDITTSADAGAYPGGGVDITDITGSALLTYQGLVSAPVFVTGPLAHAGVDNKLYGTLPFVDDQGVGFRVYFGNIFAFDFTVRAIALAGGGSEFEICTPDCINANYRGGFDLVPVETPLPASLPLFVGGLLAGSAALWRRRCRQTKASCAGGQPRPIQ